MKPIAEKGHTDAELQKLAADFRKLPKPAIGRIHDGSLIFDLRCLRDESELLDQINLLNN